MIDKEEVLALGISTINNVAKILDSLTTPGAKEIIKEEFNNLSDNDLDIMFKTTPSLVI